MTRGPKPRPLTERFFEKIEPITESGCWIWTGCLNNKGYGQVRGDDGSTVTAHRASYMMHKAEIPDGMLVLHDCDIRCCVNPDHLYVGTAAENTEDARTRGKLCCGERNPSSRLTSGQVVEIRQRLKGNDSMSSIASMFDVGRKTISDISNGKTWRHI